MSALDIVGWISSILVVWSLMQARVLRFRVMNLAGASLATVVNALLGIWPFAAMNGVIAVIDVYWIWKLTRERHDDAAYEVVEVGVADAYLRYQLRVHDEDIATTHPGFTPPPTSLPGAGDASDASAERSAFLVLRGDETVGMVLVRDAGAGVGEVELDYVTERFRDFTPGEFVYRKSGIFAGKGFTLLRADAGPGTSDHYGRVGFQRVGDHWERPVPAAA
jgi:hypothetical protein